MYFSCGRGIYTATLRVPTKCCLCRRKIKRCIRSSLEDNYCDDCEEDQLYTSTKEYFPVKKIDILSGLLIDRKNKFLFVGEGDFSFTVAFNAYRQYLLSNYHHAYIRGALKSSDIKKFSEIQQYPDASDENLIRGFIICLRPYVFEKAVNNLLEKIVALAREKWTPDIERLRKIVLKINSCLEEANKCLEKVNIYLVTANTSHDRENITMELFSSVQEVNHANDFLVEAIREVDYNVFKKPIPEEQIESLKKEIESLNTSYSKVMKAVDGLLAGSRSQ